LVSLLFVGSKEDDVVLVVSSEADEAIGPESDILAIDKRYEDGLGLIRGFLVLKYMRDEAI
jgi:hypothetical protein